MFNTIGLLFNKSIQELNVVMRGLFSDHKDQKELVIQTTFIFFVFYLIGKDVRLKHEAVKIHNYIVNPTENQFTPDRTIYDSLYIILISMLEADKKSKKSGGFLKKMDQILVRNIEIAQESSDIDYDPSKTPVTGELLIVFSSLFDTLDVEYYISQEIERKIFALEKIIN